MQLRDAIASGRGWKRVSGRPHRPSHMNPVQWAMALRDSGVPSEMASAAISISDESTGIRARGRHEIEKAADTFGEMHRYGPHEGIITASGKIMKMDNNSADMYQRIRHDPDTAHIGLSDDGEESHGFSPWRYREESYKYDY